MKCQGLWDQKTTCFICKTCNQNKNACFCTNCFINGNHEGHDYSFCESDYGFCDCIGNNEENFEKIITGSFLSPKLDLNQEILTKSDLFSQIDAMFINFLINSQEKHIKIMKILSSMIGNADIRIGIRNCTINYLPSIYQSFLSIYYKGIDEIYTKNFLYLAKLCLMAFTNIIEYTGDFISKFLLMQKEVYFLMIEAIYKGIYSINSDFMMIQQVLIQLFIEFWKNCPKILSDDNLECLYSMLSNLFPLLMKYYETRAIEEKRNDDTNYIEILFSLNYETCLLFHEFSKLNISAATICMLLIDAENGFNDCVSSPLSQDSKIRIFIAPYVLLSLVIENYGSFPKEISKNSIILLQYRLSHYFATLYFVAFGFFVRNSSKFLSIIDLLSNHTNSFIYTYNFFKLSQFLFMECENKELFIKNAIVIFGIESVYSKNIKDSKTSNHLDYNEYNNIFFSFFHFVFSLLIGYSTPKEHYFKEIMSNMLFQKPQKYSDFYQVFPESFYDDSIFTEILNEIAVSSDIHGEKSFRIIESQEINTFHPWISLRSILSNTGSLFEKKDDEKYYIPSISSRIKSFLPLSALNATAYLALFLYSMESSFPSNPTLKLIFKYIFESYQVNQSIEQNETIYTYSLSDLITKIPSNICSFIHAQISISNKAIISFENILKSSGKVSEKLCVFLGIGNNHDDIPKTKHKMKPKQLKDSILSDFNNRMKAFNEIIEEEEYHENDNYLCEVCHERSNEKLVLPIYAIKSSHYSSIFENDHYISLLISSCSHPIHETCMIKNNQISICPVDRLRRNAHILYFPPYFFNNPVPLCNESIIVFNSKNYLITPQIVIHTLNDMLHSYMILLQTKEIQFGNHSSFNTFRSLFVSLWQYKQSHTAEPNQFNNSVMKIIDFISSSKDPKKEFSDIVISAVQDFEIHLFGFIVFSIKIENTCHPIKYNYGESFFKYLPESFIDFLKPPFEIPIFSRTQSKLSLCLFTGKIVSIVGNVGEKLLFHLQNSLKSSFGVFLMLHRTDASRIVIISGDGSMFWYLPSPYVDKWGENDIGLKRGNPIYLSKTKMHQIIEIIFSGSFLNNSVN